jgi:transposase InsO family protein
VKFEFIAAEKAHYPVEALCRVLGVSRSGYYASRGRPESGRAARARELGDRVDAIFGRSRRTYGSPRILAELRAEGTRVGRNQVIAAMQDKGLVARSRRRFRPTTMSDHEQPVPGNVLDRQFDALAPNVTWVADTTELLIGQSGQRAFLAAVVDLYSRYVVGWALSAVNDRHLTLKALDMAIRSRRPAPGLLHHSDQGSTYASDDYQRKLEHHEIASSMSRRGNCLDNAAMESWFKTLKAELGDQFASFADAKAELFDYIEVFYNQRRRHSVLGYVSPAEFEKSTVMVAAA